MAAHTGPASSTAGRHGPETAQDDSADYIRDLCQAGFVVFTVGQVQWHVGLGVSSVVLVQLKRREIGGSLFKPDGLSSSAHGMIGLVTEVPAVSLKLCTSSSWLLVYS